MVIVDERSGESPFGSSRIVPTGTWHDAEEILGEWAEELPQAL